MSLRKAASLGAVQSFVTMLCGFLSVKVTSVFLGPAGMGVLSQLQYFITMAQTGVVSGLSTGLVRRTAEQGPGGERQALVVSTVLRVVLAIGVPIALVMLFAAEPLASRLLHNPELAMPVRLFSFTYLFGLVAALLTGTATGAKDYKSTTLINIGTMVSGLVLYAVFCPWLGVTGGLIAAACVPLATLAIGWTISRRRGRHWWPGRPWAHGFSAREARLALGFIPMSAVGAILVPLVQILIRDELALRDGMASVGMLQAVMRISDMYVGLASNVLAMYYLPRFSEIRVASEMVRELRRALLVLVPAVAAVSFTIWLLRDLVIHVILTKDFLPMRDLFGWQMFGNVFKILAWLLGALLLAKANPIVVAGFEFVTYTLWWALAVQLIRLNGAVGAPQAYAAIYILYSCVAAIGIAMILRNMRRRGVAVAAD